MNKIATTFAALTLLAGLPACDSADKDSKKSAAKDSKKDGKKDTKKDAKKDAKAGADDKKAAAAKPAEKAAEPPPLAKQDLAKTGLTIDLPATAKVSEAIIAGADQINFEGVQSAMVVKPRLVTDKELPAMEEFAKGHQIQKFEKEILKEGKDKTYTYMYGVDMGGMKKVVYAQMFQIGDKDFMCFANADDEAAARAFKRSCDTVAAKG